MSVQAQLRIRETQGIMGGIRHELDALSLVFLKLRLSNAVAGDDEVKTATFTVARSGAFPEMPGIAIQSLG